MGAPSKSTLGKAGLAVLNPVAALQVGTLMGAKKAGEKAIDAVAPEIPAPTPPPPPTDEAAPIYRELARIRTDRALRAGQGRSGAMKPGGGIYG